MGKKNFNQNKNKILVTGVAGFIGSHLCEKLLKKGYTVLGVDSFTDFYPKTLKEKNLEVSLQNSHFKFIKADILNLTSIDEDIEYIFHVAAQPGVRTSWGMNFDTYIKDNILATQHLLELSKNHKGLKKFIYSSSSSVYGNAEMFPTREDTLPKPVSPYGVTKLAGEHLCQLYLKNYNVPIICLRYFTVFGPRQRPDMAFNKFIKSMLREESLTVYGDGEQSRDFTYVSDVVDANILAMQKDTKEIIFNIGGGNYATINRIIHTLKELIKFNIKVEYKEKAKGDVRDTKADISRAKRELGFNPKYDLNYGLEREIEWVKSIYNLK
ncbi:UDP-N-acetylglucosamine 4-epimerase [subsurface metagenome]